MTDSKYTHLLVITDESGSMSPVANDMRGALNTFFKDQAEVKGKCLVDYYNFSSVVDKRYEDKPVADAEAMLNPHGMTALLDAVGVGVTDLGKKLAALPEGERPGTVIVAVVTDGYENMSRKWSASAIKELIKQQEDEYSWQFTFLGANMDAVAVGESFGFSAQSSLTYDVHNTGAMSASLSNHTTRIRGGDFTGYTSDERAAQNV
jgi:hypothetical protein